MTPDVPAFVSTGGAVVIACVVLIAILVAAVVIPRVAKDEYELWPDGADGPDPSADERRTVTTLYGVPVYDRRVENVAPTRTDKWL